jgi:16S rRNA (uracil1498-N3)-methyltransferase
MKKIHRFLLAKIPTGPTLTLEDTDLVHLIKNVLKLGVGEQCIVFSGGGNDYLSTIVEIEKKSVTLNIESEIPKKNIPKKITACISITKRDNFELVVQKLTELGIHTIVPIISDRTIKQALRIDRLQKISDEALEQSGGSNRVLITEPETLETSLIKRKNIPQYCFDMDGEKLVNGEGFDAVFYIGPEGGWSDEEKNLFKDHGVKICSLGETVLRAETATIVAGYKLLWD